MISCTSMRAAVVLSAALFLSGTLLLLVAEVTSTGVPTAHTALLLVLAGAAVLAVALLVALFPGNADRLSNCRH